MITDEKARKKPTCIKDFFKPDILNRAIKKSSSKKTLDIFINIAVVLKYRMSKSDTNTLRLVTWLMNIEYFILSTLGLLLSIQNLAFLTGLLKTCLAKSQAALLTPPSFVTKHFDFLPQ